MSRPDRYSQYLIIDRIQAVISFIDGYSESTDKPTCRSQKSPMAKTKWLKYRNIYRMGSWNTIKTTRPFHWYKFMIGICT